MHFALVVALNFLCQVSKWFCEITYDTTVWKILYTYSSFPRPPGPFPTKSHVLLGRTLLKVARLARSWTTRSMRAISSLTIKTVSPPECPKLIHGRWLVVCEWARCFVLFDTDPAAKIHTRQVLWEQENQVVAHWDVGSATSAEGQCIVYVLFASFGALPEWYVWSSFVFLRSGFIYMHIYDFTGSFWNSDWIMTMASYTVRLS